MHRCIAELDIASPNHLHFRMGFLPGQYGGVFYSDTITERCQYVYTEY